MKLFKKNNPDSKYFTVQDVLRGIQEEQSLWNQNLGGDKTIRNVMVE